MCIVGCQQICIFLFAPICQVDNFGNRNMGNNFGLRSIVCLTVTCDLGCSLPSQLHFSTNYDPNPMESRWKVKYFIFHMPYFPDITFQKKFQLIFFSYKIYLKYIHHLPLIRRWSMLFA